MSDTVKRRAGAQPKPPEERRTNAFLLRMNEEERRRLQRLSAQRGEAYAVVLRAALIAMERRGRGRDEE